MFPTPHVLGVRRLTSGSTGAHGNATKTLADPIDWHVHALVPGSMQEPNQPNRDLSIVAWSVLAPKSEQVPTADDVVVLDDEDYEVVGDPQDFTRGPWSAPFAGVVVELTRSEG